MKQTLVVKLAPTRDQHAALLATMERVNRCCDWLATVAFRERCANRIALQKLTYYEARERFGLSSQMVVRAISKTVEAYKRDKTICPRFKPHGAIPYDQRIMAWKGVEAVSLLTLTGRVVVPVRFGEYQAARRGRLRGQADLVYRDSTFFLYCTLEVPEPTPIEAEDSWGLTPASWGKPECWRNAHVSLAARCSPRPSASVASVASPVATTRRRDSGVSAA